MDDGMFHVQHLKKGKSIFRCDDEWISGIKAHSYDDANAYLDKMIAKHKTSESKTVVTVCYQVDVNIDI